MNRSRLNFLIDALAFTAFAFLTTSGVPMRDLPPRGSGRWALPWGRSRHDWAGISVDTPLRQLAVPTGTDPDERIGRLRRVVGIGPDEVRAAVRELSAERQP